jgi:CRISPR-associated protein Csh1
MGEKVKPAIISNWNELKQKIMLHTLIEIGKQVSEQGRHPWEDFLLNIKLNARDAEKNLLMLRLVFDVDAGVISADDNIERYLPERRAGYGLIDILKGNNKAIYAAVEAKNLDKLGKALFGKEIAGDNGKWSELSEFQEAIHKDTLDLEASELYEALIMIKPFAPVYYEKFRGEKNKLVIKDVAVGKQDLLVGVYVAITCAGKGWNRKPLAQMEGYEAFIERKFLSSTAAKEGSESGAKLCYASGEIKEDTAEANFSARYNLNKIFQSTTINYASNFEGGDLSKNYQLSEETRQYLDRGSQKVLSEFHVTIAGLPHVCIPRLPIGSEDYDIDAYRRLRDRTDLLFRLKDIESILSEMDDQADSNLYWLDFYGFESDGNFLKMTNHIRDVSGVHIGNVIHQSKKASQPLARFIRNKVVNLGSMYFLIPVRKDLKANPALELCKMVLEQRPVKESLLWRHFTDLVLCHWYGRYGAYANIQEPTREDIIDLLLREAVFSYHAFRQLLINLNLIIMEPNQTKVSQGGGAQIEADTLRFLDEMGYSTAQRAMFFLGKALKRVVSVQRKDSKNKTALDLVNFNGLDERSIRNLAAAIMEKGRQYNPKVQGGNFAKGLEYDLNRFYQHFPAGENSWRMDNREALFYFLAGYTHFLPKSEEPMLENNSDNQ